MTAMDMKGGDTRNTALSLTYLGAFRTGCFEEAGLRTHYDLMTSELLSKANDGEVREQF